MADEPQRAPIDGPTPSQPPRFELPPNLAQLDPPSFIRALQRFYFSTDPRTGRLVRSRAEAQELGLQAVGRDEGDAPWVFPNNTTPKNVLVLIDFLEHYTNTILLEVKTSRWAEFVGANDAARIRREFDEWRERLKNYRSATVAAIGLPKAPGSQFGTFFTNAVVNPLLIGWYPQQDQQQIADMVTPIMLGRQSKINLAALQLAWEKLGQDLVENAKNVARVGVGIAIPLAVVAVLVAAFAYGSKKGS